MRSKSRAWRASSRRCRKKTQAMRLSSDAIEVALATPPYGASCSATASSATQKLARSVIRRARRSSGRCGHARASGARSMAAASHCRRATTREKKLGQKLRGTSLRVRPIHGSSRGPACRSGIAARYQAASAATASRCVTMASMTRRRIYLMRHAEAAYFSRPSAPVDPARVALTEIGLEQARAAGRTLHEVRFDRVVTSGLARPVRTAQLVVEQLAHPPAGSDFHEVPDLQELRPGDLDAVRDEDLEASFLTAWRGVPPADATFLGGETVGSLVDRVGRAMARILAGDDWDTMLLVAHGGTNRAILSAALAGPGAFFGQLEQSPGCINVLDTA